MTTAQDRDRQNRTIIVLLSVTIFIICLAIGGQFLINGSLRSQSSDQHDAQVHACQQGNQHLRGAINRRLVAPLRRRNVEVKTVPYAVCHNLYPESGKPRKPFYRNVPVPPLVGKATTAVTGSTASTPASAPVTSQGTDSGSHPKKSKGSGATGQTPAPAPTPSPPAATPPSSSPSQSPGLVCGLTGICVLGL